MTGTVELLPAGTFGVDYSFARPALADLLTLKAGFASRYVCIDNALTHDKLVTLDEIRRLADAGILMMINYEQGESTTLGGEAAGRRHGPVAGDWRAYLQMPDELAIVISTDVGVTRAQYNAISDFCAAFSETGGGKIGHYHGTTLCAHLEGQGLNDLTWMAMATAWSPGGDENHETPAVHVRQKGYVLGSCDANYVRKPTPFWNFNGDRLDPTEGDFTMAQMDAINARFDALDASTRAIWDVLTQPIDGIPTDSGMQWNIALLRDHIVDKNHLVDRIVAALPVGAGLTEAQVREIINSTSLKTG